MNLQAGLYKVKLDTLIETYAFLKVFRKDDRLMYQINSGSETDIDFLQERDPCTVVKRIRELAVGRATMQICFTDADGDYFTFGASDVQMVRRLFKEYPNLARALGVQQLKVDTRSPDSR